MIINSVLTPLIRKELPELLLWIKICPKPSELSSNDEKINWFLSIDSHWTDVDKAAITTAVFNSNLANVVNLIFLSLEIDPNESVYLKGANVANNHKYLRLGNASGPNTQFFLFKR